MQIVKPLIRFGVVTVLAGGAVAVIAGPQRMAAFAGQARTAVQDTIDSQIDDPVRLRSQLKSLAAEYPTRIAEVRSDLAELQTQSKALTREQAVSTRVVELASADLGQMQDLLARAEAAQQGGSGFQVVKVSFDNRSMDLDQAYAKANSIRRLKQSYETRMVSVQRDLDLLGSQEQRLAELLTQLETEQQEFQSQIWQLDQKVEAIARNDRMIDLMEKREKTIAKYDSYSAHSLDQVQGNIAKILAEQEGRLQGLARGSEQRDYAEQAEYELDAMLRSGAMTDFGVTTIEPAQPDTLEISPTGSRLIEADKTECDKEVASRH